MYKYKLTISYDGSSYHGWQVQPTGDSIQQIVQKAIETIVRSPTSLTGAGRTDAGVHALGQTAHITSDKEIDIPSFHASLNGLLPKDIRVLTVESVENSFHARYSAKAKVYHYHLCLDRYPSPFKRLYTTHLKQKIDLSLLDHARKLFIGTHDFTSFANEAHRGSASRSPIKTIKRIDLVEEEGGLRIEFEGDGFLYKMVRNIVGTLLEVASGQLMIEEIAKIFRARDRSRAGSCAPPTGLFLIEVKY